MARGGAMRVQKVAVVKGEGRTDRKASEAKDNKARPISQIKVLSESDEKNHHSLQ